MTVWRKGISWSKFKLALSCPQQLVYSIERTPYAVSKPNFYAQRGTVAQKVFEVYFNQGVNLREGGASKEVLKRCVDKVFESNWFQGLEITYPRDVEPGQLKTDVTLHVLRGYELFESLGVLDLKIRSEVDWGAVFRNFRLFGKMDFVIDSEDSKAVWIFDGKGNRAQDADEGQLLFYSLIAMASGKEVRGAGFLYWQSEYKEVDVTVAAVKRFLDEKFVEAAKIFQMLKTGVDSLPVYPERNKCYNCNWCQVCPHSLVARELADHAAAQTVGFGEAV